MDRQKTDEYSRRQARLEKYYRQELSTNLHLWANVLLQSRKGKGLSSIVCEDLPKIMKELKRPINLPPALLDIPVKRLSYRVRGRFHIAACPQCWKVAKHEHGGLKFCAELAFLPLALVRLDLASISVLSHYDALRAKRIIRDALATPPKEAKKTLAHAIGCQMCKSWITKLICGFEASSSPQLERILIGGIKRKIGRSSIKRRR